MPLLKPAVMNILPNPLNLDPIEPFIKYGAEKSFCRLLNNIILPIDGKV